MNHKKVLRISDQLLSIKGDDKRMKKLTKKLDQKYSQKEVRVIKLMYYGLIFEKKMDAEF